MHRLRKPAYFAYENDRSFDEEIQPLKESKGTFHLTKNRNKMLDIVII